MAATFARKYPQTQGPRRAAETGKDFRSSSVHAVRITLDLLLRAFGRRAELFRFLETTMKPLFWSLARSSLVAIGLATGMATPSPAAPPMPMNQASSVTTLGTGAESIQWRRRHGGGNWSGGNWHGNNWRGGNWHGNNWRGHSHNHYGGSSIYFGLGVPYFGLGLPFYNYADPYYYAPPRYYAPRRYYRSGGLSSAHVNWCYDRYRSYREWDNTYQPYHGPRRQCWSPYR